MIYFIIGASGSGKTACMEPLKKLLTQFTIHDFDEIGLPDNADKKWRQEATEKWIKKLTQNVESKNYCLLGQMVPGEILSIPSAGKLKNIHIILLDCRDEIRIQRLRKRNNDDMNQNTLNWASWLRMHCKDPTWGQYVIKENSSSVMHFDQWDQQHTWSSSFSIHFTDTSHLSIAETAHCLKKIIDLLQIKQVKGTSKLFSRKHV